MRAMWSGSISFGLVNIPVRLYSATGESTIDLDLLHKDDMSPIRYKKFCDREGKEVPGDEIVRGFQYRKGEYVILTDEDLEKASSRPSKTIEISEFVAGDEVDSVYYEKPYYLEPDRGADKAYALLRDALVESGKVAIATYILRTRERLAIIKPSDGVLLLNQIRFQSEIKSRGELKVPEKMEAGGKELDLALTLIQHLTKPFEPAAHRDTYNDDVMRMIEAKAEGRVPVSRAAEPEPTKIVDLMEVLKASLEQVDKAA